MRKASDSELEVASADGTGGASPHACHQTILTSESLSDELSGVGWIVQPLQRKAWRPVVVALS